MARLNSITMSTTHLASTKAYDVFDQNILLTTLHRPLGTLNVKLPITDLVLVPERGRRGIIPLDQIEYAGYMITATGRLGSTTVLLRVSPQPETKTCNTPGIWLSPG